MIETRKMRFTICRHWSITNKDSAYCIGKNWSILTMQELPSELILHIFTYCEAKTLCSARRVCKTWKEQADSQILWKMLTLRDFGEPEKKITDWKQWYIELMKGQFSKEFVKPKLKPNLSGTYKFKLVLVGDAKIGKKTFLKKIKNSELIKRPDPKRNPFDLFHVYRSTSKLENASITLEIWNTPGDPAYER